ncbi:MAG: VWA domain-containing protein [Acidobacteria bacterium]|nr:VWA domain-containing protein [Acidobacteriota bacterium]
MQYCALSMRSAARLGAGIIIAVAFSVSLSQNPVLKTRSKEEREERFSTTHRIVMNVQVTDAAGNALSDLRAEEFSLYDNHKPRRIVAFHPIDGAALSDATEVLILLDAVNTPASELENQKSAIFKYLAESRKPFLTPTAFALWFNGHLSITPASTNRNAIGRAFVRLTKNMHSNACEAEHSVAAQKGASSVDPKTCRAVHFRDSVAALDGVALQQLATGGRTLLVWMGSGWPLPTESGLEGLAVQDRDSHEKHFVQVLHDLRAAQVTVYSVVFGSDSNSIGTNSGTAESSNVLMPAADALLFFNLSEFARRTGGRALHSSTDLTSSLRECARDAEWYYSVAFNAPPAQSGFGELHSLEVKIDRPNLEVRTMTSYYSEPE